VWEAGVQLRRLADARERLREQLDDTRDQVVARLRPGHPDTQVTLVVAHCRGAR